MNRADVDYLEAVQLGKRPHAVLIAAEEAEDATQNAVEGIGEGLRGSVEQRRHGEGDDALRVVEDVADVLASCRTASRSPRSKREWKGGRERGSPGGEARHGPANGCCG